MPASGGGPLADCAGATPSGWPSFWLSKRTPDLLALIPEPVFQHLGRMLAESRRRQSDRARVTVELPRCTDLADGAGPRMVDLDPHSTRRRQWAGERFFDVEDGTRRDAAFLEPG